MVEGKRKQEKTGSEVCQWRISSLLVHCVPPCKYSRVEHVPQPGQGGILVLGKIQKLLVQALPSPLQEKGAGEGEQRAENKL